MYSKNLVEKIIEKHAKSMMKDLGISHWLIKCHVVKSGESKLRKLGLTKHEREGNKGITWVADESAEMFLFYDNLSSRQDALSTLFHELLHCFMWQLRKYVTVNEIAAHKIDEKMVRVLEELCYGKVK